MFHPNFLTWPLHVVTFATWPLNFFVESSLSLSLFPFLIHITLASHTDMRGESKRSFFFSFPFSFSFRLLNSAPFQSQLRSHLQQLEVSTAIKGYIQLRPIQFFLTAGPAYLLYFVCESLYVLLSTPKFLSLCFFFSPVQKDPLGPFCAC